MGIRVWGSRAPEQPFYQSASAAWWLDPLRVAQPPHMASELLSEATGAGEGKGHTWETAGAPGSLPHTTLADSDSGQASGPGRCPPELSRAGHFPPGTAGGSIAYVFTPKQRVAALSQL